MEDQQIVDLYWRRDESAVEETDKKYNHYLKKIAYNVLFDIEDSMESVNDTYLKAWHAIPPHKPEVLSTFLGKIARQVSIDLFRKRNSQKRQASEYTLSLSELEECVGTNSTPEQHVELKALADAISTYLRTLSAQSRNIFICRYYYLDSIRDIAAYYSASQSKIKSNLFRSRNGLKAYLEKEGML